MSHLSGRTQIYLPPDLRQEVDTQRTRLDLSLAEYARQALKKQVERDKKKEKDLKALAKKVFGTPVKNSGWTKEAIAEWRKERREEDQYMEKRLDEAWKSVRKK